LDAIDARLKKEAEVQIYCNVCKRLMEHPERSHTCSPEDTKNCHEECLHKEGEESLHHHDCPNLYYTGDCRPGCHLDRRSKEIRHESGCPNADVCPCGRREKYSSPAGSYGYCIDCLHDQPMAKIDIDEENAIDAAAGFATADN
jgi:hypothetical protein